MACPRGKYQAHVEDCSDEEAANAAACKSPSANVKAKRSNDGGHEKPLASERPAPSAASDSGYSSHTAATMSSADSAPRLPSQSPPQPVDDPAPKPPPNPATTKRRPTMDGQRKTSSQASSQTVQGSPRKPLNRSTSVSSRQKPKVERPEVQECRDPNCTRCAPPSSSRGRRPSGRDSALDVSYHPSFDQRSQRSDPATYAPRSPTSTYSRQPAPSHYTQGSVLVQPGTTPRRRSSSQSRPSRPMSYHGDPSAGYWVPGMQQQQYPPPPQERGPPPSMSAHYNMPPPPLPMQPQPHHTASVLGATPPTNSYFTPQHAMQTSPPFDSQRPPMPQRTSSQRSAPYSARRPNSQYGPAVVTQNIDPQYSARYAHNGPQSAKGTQYSPNEPSDDESEYTSEDEYANTQALARPGARRAFTTQVFDDRLAHSMTLPERPRLEQDPRVSMVASAIPSRSASHSRRPPLPQNKSISYDTPENPRVYVESARDRRRQSYVGYEPTYELEDKHRRTKVYGKEAIPRRHRTNTDTRRGDDSEAKLRRAQEKAEAHQRSMRGADAPLTEDALNKAARRSSKVITRNSKGSSRHSDEASRVSQTRTSVTNGNNEIRLRVDASAPIKLDFNGDVEGRTISFNPTDGGMADIVIASSQGSETIYPERRSFSTAPQRKAITNGNSRREAEESSVKSRRSHRSAREEERRPERRPLRRPQGFYHN